MAQTRTALLCVAFLRFLTKPGNGWLLSAGLLCVLAYLTRPAAAYAVLVPLWMCWHVRTTRSLLAFVVVGPLTVWLSWGQPRRWVRTFVWGLLSVHAGNAVIMVVFLYPQARYLNATELFVFIAAAVALWARQPWLGRHASHHA